MAMVVKNNMAAVSTLNTLNRNSGALQKSLAKVSSGMKINSAQDDASGYAISERMRVQIRALDQANQNTQNGASLMKTAEGAVSSTIEILKTLKEKAINAATDTNTDEDRATIQKEVNQFIDQIDDNALVTFNGKYLVDGSKVQSGDATKTAFTNQSLEVGTTGGTKITDLRNRKGEDLEIISTDKITASFVKDGQTYSTTFKVGESSLEDIFNNLNKESQAQAGDLISYDKDGNSTTVAADTVSYGYKGGAKFQALDDSNSDAAVTALKSAGLTNTTLIASTANIQSGLAGSITGVDAADVKAALEAKNIYETQGDAKAAAENSVVVFGGQKVAAAAGTSSSMTVEQAKGVVFSADDADLQAIAKGDYDSAELPSNLADLATALKTLYSTSGTDSLDHIASDAKTDLTNVIKGAMETATGSTVVATSKWSSGPIAWSYAATDGSTVSTYTTGVDGAHANVYATGTTTAGTTNALPKDSIENIAGKIADDVQAAVDLYASGQDDSGSISVAKDAANIVIGSIKFQNADSINNSQSVAVASGEANATYITATLDVSNADTIEKFAKAELALKAADRLVNGAPLPDVKNAAGETIDESNYEGLLKSDALKEALAADDGNGNSVITKSDGSTVAADEATADDLLDAAVTALNALTDANASQPQGSKLSATVTFATGGSDLQSKFLAVTADTNFAQKDSTTPANNMSSDARLAIINAYELAVDAYNNKGAETIKKAVDDKNAASAGSGSTTDPLVAPGNDNSGSSYIGLDTAGQEVHTADSTEGLTVTANNEGLAGQISGLTISVADAQGSVKKTANVALNAFGTTIFAANASPEDTSLKLHVGGAANQSISVGLQDMRAEALGLKGSDGSVINLTTQTRANAAVAAFDNALQKALDQQTTIGAIEARLEYTSSNLTASSENVQAAESAIRDADMAKEMTNYTKNNVLLQAAQSMLAQANQNASAVLSLLQ